MYVKHQEVQGIREYIRKRRKEVLKRFYEDKVSIETIVHDLWNESGAEPKVENGIEASRVVQEIIRDALKSKAKR